jgi:glutathione S-transferase
MGRYVAGPEFSIADVALAPIVARCLRFGVELPSLPNVKRWDAEMQSREAFRKATAA